MAKEYSEELFEVLNKKLDKHKSWHKDQYNYYSGKWSPSSLGIALNANLDNKIQVNLDFSRIEIDFLANQLVFDAFDGDDWNLLDYFEISGCDKIIKSAIKNSMIGSCAFVSISPGSTELGEPPVVFTPYTGYEATGIFNSRTGKLDVGLAIESYDEDGEPESFYIFLPDGTYLRDKEGNITKLFESKTGVQLVPFVYEQDLASRPFGRARTNVSQVNLAGSAIRTLKRSEISSEFFASPLRYIFTKIDENSSSETGEDDLDVWNSTIGQLLEYRTSSESTPEIGELTASSPEPYIKQFNMFVEQYAANAGMNPQEFGVSPSNGALSADAEAERSRKMKNLISECKLNYGYSIKEMSIHAAGVLGIEIVPDMHRMRILWSQTVLDSDLGKIGDALGKLFSAVPELSETDYAYEKLGISKRSRIDRSGALPDEGSKKRLMNLSDELKDIISKNANDPENRISGVSPSEGFEV